MWYVGQQREMHAHAKIAALEALQAQAVAHAESLTTRVRVDTIKVTTVRNRWLAASAPIRTLPLDTLPEAHALVVVCDSAITTDSTAIHDLTALVQAKDTLLKNSEAQVSEWRHLAKGRFVRPAVELTYAATGPDSLVGRLDALAEVEIGRGPVSFLARRTMRDGRTDVGLHISF